MSTLKLVGDAKRPIVGDIEAESKILGALLYDPRHLPAIPERLKPASFVAGGSHAHIFAAVLQLRDADEDVNVQTVGTVLHDNGRLDQLAGRIEYLIKLTNETEILTPKTFAFLTASVVNKATQRDLSLMLARAHARCTDPGLDIGAELADLEREILGLSLNTHGGSSLIHIGDALRAEVKEWVSRSETKTMAGISTGFVNLDEHAGRLHPGDLIVLGARPAMGKTALIANMAVNVSKAGLDTAIFSLEMPAGQIAGRMLCTEAAVQLSNVRHGRFDDDERTRVMKALSDLRELGVHIDDATRGRPTAKDIVSRTRRLAADLARKGKKLGLVVVDYIQIVQLDADLRKQRHDLAVGDVSLELKSLAKELGTTVVACAQLNRGVEGRPDKRPGLADLRDSGQIEQDADMVWMMYRDEYYNPETEDRGIVEVIVEKNRHGEPGTAYLRFHGPTTSFRDDLRLQYERSMR